MEKSGVILKEWKIDNKSGELDIEQFKSLLNSKTKIVAVTHCSNIVGSVNQLKLISDLAHEFGAIVIGDGVSFAPHGFLCKTVRCEFYTFSLYKTRPHLPYYMARKY